MPRWEKLTVYNSETEAEIVRGRLESEGIEARISADDCGGMLPQYQYIRGVRLLVAPEDIERAREILGLDADG